MDIDKEYSNTILKRLRESENEQITLISGQDNQR